MFVVVETLGADVDYSLRATVTQGPVTISSVAPLAGGPGTLVRIVGTGFSISQPSTRVMFGGVSGRVESVSPTVIEARVPAAAVDGPMIVISGARRTTGPQFLVGRTEALPPPTMTAGLTPGGLRRDPADGEIFDVTKLLVWLQPESTRAQLDALLATMGGRVGGAVPSQNQFYLEFPGTTTIAALETARRQLLASGLVRRGAARHHPCAGRYSYRLA